MPSVKFLFIVKAHNKWCLHDVKYKHYPNSSKLMKSTFLARILSLLISSISNFMSECSEIFVTACSAINAVNSLAICSPISQDQSKDLPRVMALWASPYLAFVSKYFLPRPLYHALILRAVNFKAVWTLARNIWAKLGKRIRRWLDQWTRRKRIINFFGDFIYYYNSKVFFHLSYYP